MILIIYLSVNDLNVYRKEFIECLIHNSEIPTIKEITNFGNGSSFTGRKKPSSQDLINRKNQIDLPKETIERLKSEDIIEIRRKLGYI